MIKFIVDKILQFLFGYESVEYKAQLGYEIYNALLTNDIEIINKYCRSKEAIDIMACRMYDIYFNRSNAFTYTYDEKNFNSLKMLKNLCNNKKTIHISEFVALLFYLRSSISLSITYEHSLAILKGKEIDVYSKFLDRI